MIATVLSSGMLCANKFAELIKQMINSNVERQYFAQEEYINLQIYMVCIEWDCVTIPDYEPRSVDELD